MLHATKNFVLNFGDTAKFVLQYENTLLNNTGDKPAIIQASKEGYDWVQIANIEPHTSLPLKIDTLYIRLITDTKVTVVNTGPIARQSSDSQVTASIDTQAFPLKTDLDAYVTKAQLNTLVHLPDLSDYVTTSQVKKLLPTPVQLPDLSGFVTTLQLETKADKQQITKLENAIATKAEATEVTALKQTATQMVIPTLTHLQQTKADNKALETLTTQLQTSDTQVQALSQQVLGFQNQIDNHLTKEQAATQKQQLLELVNTKANIKQVEDLAKVVEQKANLSEVAELTNKAFHLEQDKADRAEMTLLQNTLKVIQRIISGQEDASVMDIIKADIRLIADSTLPDMVDAHIPDNLGEDQLRELETKLLAVIRTKADARHQHTLGDIIGLQAALDTKASTSQIDAKNTNQDTEIAKKADQTALDALTAIVGTKADRAYVDSKNTAQDIELNKKANQSQVDDLRTQLQGKAEQAQLTRLDEKMAASIAAAERTASTLANQSWDTLAGKPQSFPPSTHRHVIADIDTLQAQLDNKAQANHSHAIDQASTHQAGIVRLNDTISSSSTTQAATANAVKTVADIANAKQSPATSLEGYGITDFKVQTATGDLNTFRTDGIYSFNSKTAMTNSPIDSESRGSGHLIVISGGEANQNWCRQIFKKHYSNETYERYQTYGTANTWSEWKRTDASLDLNQFHKQVSEDSGYQMLPSGLILQWGKHTNNQPRPLHEYDTIISFPVRFTTKCLSVQATTHMNNYTSTAAKYFNGSIHIARIDTSRFFALIAPMNTAYPPDDLDSFYWFAIGH